MSLRSLPPFGSAKRYLKRSKLVLLGVASRIYLPVVQGSVAESLLGGLIPFRDIETLTTWGGICDIEKHAANDAVRVVIVETGGTNGSPVVTDGNYFVHLFRVDDIDEIHGHYIPPILGWIGWLVGAVIAK